MAWGLALPPRLFPIPQVWTRAPAGEAPNTGGALAGTKLRVRASKKFSDNAITAYAGASLPGWALHSRITWYDSLNFFPSAPIFGSNRQILAVLRCYRKIP
jgi:hypothetical protein